MGEKSLWTVRGFWSKVVVELLTIEARDMVFYWINYL